MDNEWVQFLAYIVNCGMNVNEAYAAINEHLAAKTKTDNGEFRQLNLPLGPYPGDCQDCGAVVIPEERHADLRCERCGTAL